MISITFVSSYYILAYRCLSEVKLSASALTDHLPKAVASTLEKLVESQQALPTVPEPTVPTAVVVDQQPLPT